MYSMKDAVIRNMELMEENQHLKADLKRFADLNDSLIEDNEALQKKLEHAEAVRKRIIDADAKEREELHAKIDQLQTELAYERRHLSDSAALWSECECEINRLRTELAEERNRFDKLSDFEVAQAEDFQEAKLYLRILMEYLAETGHDVEKLEKIIALKRCIMKLEETNE